MARPRQPLGHQPPQLVWLMAASQPDEAVWCFLVGSDMRQAARRDTAEGPIVRDLRKLGYDVTRVSGEGAPDILVRKRPWRGRCFGFEVKSDGGRQTPAQEETDWPIVRSLDDVLQFMRER